MPPDIPREQLDDLVRSGWLVERARAVAYQRWAATESSYADASAHARARAEVIEASFPAARHDEALVQAHSAWILSVIGDRPGDVDLAEFFIVRLGDWVDTHLGPFVAGADTMVDLLAQDKERLEFPTRGFPAPPPYAPVIAPQLQPIADPITRFAVLGDLHVGSGNAEALVGAAIDDINRSGAEITIQLGDLSDHGTEQEFGRARDVLDRLDMPWVATMGNHDVLDLHSRELSGRRFFERCFGRTPDGILIEHAGFHFLCLDSAEDAASPFPPFDIVTGAFTGSVGGAVVSGSLTVPQHDLLADVAAPGAPPAFVFLHHPPQPYTGFPPVLFGLNGSDSGRLHATCDSGNVWGIFAGHTHRNARTTTYSGVPAQELAIPRDYPHGFTLVDVGRHGYAYRFVQISDEELLRASYDRSSAIQRRYAIGSGPLSFSWSRGDG